jgi:hypothetical protein
VEEPPSEASIPQFEAIFWPKSRVLSRLVDCPLPILAFISTRQVAAAAALLLYSTLALRQVEPVTVMFCVAAATATLILLLPNFTTAIRLLATFAAFVLFVASRIESRRAVLAASVFVWVSASAYFTRRLLNLKHRHHVSLAGTISDLWLIAMLTLLSLEGYIVTGLLLLSAASWIPRTGKTKVWFAVAYALLGGWLIIAAKLDINLELRRWYLLGALAVGIGASLVASAQEVQQREDIHPE